MRYGAQTPFSDQLAFHFEGSAWQVDSTHDSIIAAGNGSSQPVKARLTFFYGNGSQKYEIEQTIGPDDELLVDIGKLIRERIPDKNGNLLPGDLTTGAYRLLDLAETPAASLYEGKVVTDKTWGHATYGCGVCCGYRGVYFSPDPSGVAPAFSTGVQAMGINACTSGDSNVSGYATSWTSGNTGILTAQTRQVTGVNVGSTGHYAELTNILYGPARNGYPCPLQSVPTSGTGNVVRVQITNASITQDQVTVVLSAAQSVTGNLSVTLNGPTSVTLGQANGVGPGTYNYSFGRVSLASGEYTSVSASWTAGTGASASTPVSFNVLGMTRFSTYNTPYESQCTGGTAVAYIFVNNLSTCTYSTTNLNSAFMSQVGINGTGSSVSSGIVKVFNATAVGQSCELPPGGIGSGSSANTFVGVPSVTGACNATMLAGNLATYPDPVPSNASWNCSDQVLLLNSSNQVNATGGVTDYCPACSTGFNGTSGHIDHYSSAQACTVGSFSDYGNFYAIRLR